MSDQASEARCDLMVPRVTQEFFPVVSGPANQALALARGLATLGISSPIFTTTPAHGPDPDGAVVRRFLPLLAAPNVRFAPGLLRAVHAEPMAVLHIHGWRNPMSDGALVVALQRGVPTVVQSHGVANGYRYADEPVAVRGLRQAYEAVVRPLVARCADRVIASTQAEADELMAYGVPQGRIAVIPIGVDPRFLAAEPAGCGPQRPLTLLAVGRLGPRRNLEQALHALARLHQHRAGVRLRIVGPEVTLAAGEPGGYRRSLEHLADELGVASHVEFTGALRGAELLAAYQAADIFVCTTRYENFGQPIAEAAALGLPIVATPTGVAPELLAHGRAGILVPCDDVDATAAALVALGDNPGVRLALGAEARSLARRFFDWERIVPQYAALYREVVREQRAARGRAARKVRSARPG